MTHSSFNGHGPIYNIGGAQIERWRRVARGKGSLMKMKYEERCSYAEAVLDTVRRSQRSSLQRELPSHAPNCASGTAHQTGKAILRAVHQQNATVCSRAYDNPAKMAGDPVWGKCECKTRTCCCNQWDQRSKAVYAAMMEEKRARQTVVLVARQKPKRRKR